MTDAYRLVQVSKSFFVKSVDDQSISEYVQTTMNDDSDKGWECQRMDTVHVFVPPGPRASLFGHEETTALEVITTFRRPVEMER